MEPAVLFVDDSAVARATATRQLRTLGLSVTAVASSREAAAMDGARFAAALLDIELGDGLGTEVARRLRDEAPRLPIAFLSGSDAGALREEARQYGPVFSKTSEVDEAIRWIAERAANAPPPP